MSCMIGKFVNGPWTTKCHVRLECVWAIFNQVPCMIGECMGGPLATKCRVWLENVWMGHGQPSVVYDWRICGWAMDNQAPIHVIYVLYVYVWLDTVQALDNQVSCMIGDCVGHGQHSAASNKLSTRNVWLHNTAIATFGGKPGR